MEHARSRVQTFAEVDQCQDVHQIVSHLASGERLRPKCNCTWHHRRKPQPPTGAWYDVGLRAHHVANDFSLFNVKNTAQTLSEYLFNDRDHVPIGYVRRPSCRVFEPALRGPQDRDCAPVPSGAPDGTQVGWIQSLLYPSSMVIGQ